MSPARKADSGAFEEIRSHGWGKAGACLLLALATFSIYSRVLGNGFTVYDDQLYITDNPEVQGGLSLQGLEWAFTTGRAANWHPLTWLSHMLDCELFGLAPGPQHLVSLLLHTASTLLLFLVLDRMTGALGRSAFVALLFALHPLHVESVAWLAERKDVLSAFFWMLTMGAYALYVERPRLHRYLLVLLFFTLGLMSKPMLVTLPFVLLLLDFWPLRRMNRAPDGADVAASDRPPPAPRRERSPSAVTTGSEISAARAEWRRRVRHLLAEKIPFLLLALASSVVTYLVQRSGGSVAEIEEFSPGRRVANALVSYVRYVLKTVWPDGLAAFYPYPASWPVWATVGSALLLASGTVLILRSARERPYLATGWLWYLGTLVPVIGLVQVGMQSAADRYTYIPIVGLFMMVAWGVVELAEGWHHGKALVAASGVAVVLPLAVVSWRQVGYWKDTVTLFNHALAVTSDNAVAHNILGTLLAEEQKLDEAIVHYTQALRIVPNRQTHTNLGLALAIQGRFEEAMAHYEAALRLGPDDARAQAGLAEVLDHQGRAEEAAAHYAAAVRLSPDDAKARTNFGACLAGLGRVEEAISQYEAAIRSKPDFAEAHSNLGAALSARGKIEEAIDEYRKAVRLKPDFADAHLNLGSALLALGKIDEAIGELEQVLRLRPGDPAAQAALRRALARQQKRSGAAVPPPRAP